MASDLHRQRAAIALWSLCALIQPLAAGAAEKTAAKDEEADLADPDEAERPDRLPWNTISIGAGSLYGMFSVEYERVVNRNVSAAINTIFSFRGASLVQSDLLRLELEGRYFFFDEAPRWLFVGVQLHGRRSVSPDPNGTGYGDNAGFGAGALVGYTFLFGDIVTLSLGLGGGFDYLILLPANTRELWPDILIRCRFGFAF